jgi:translation initiation factor 3 subunit I
MILTVQDKSFKKIPAIFVYNINKDTTSEDSKENTAVRRLSEEDPSTQVISANWVNVNQNIIATDDAGAVALWDVEKGTLVLKKQLHKKAIKNFRFYKDSTMMVTASEDMRAKLVDTKSLEVVKTYVSDRPLNAAAISPVRDHVIIGGGQDASLVTTTDARSGHFEIDFHHMIFEDKMGSVGGHFGPVNTLDFSPDGKAFVTGGEDGYVRLHHFDADYFTNKV